ncbi:MAG: type II toxin-antitoxin system Phd/YefM family antitoxin [Verrucomicrobiota bacterium]
MDMIPLYEAKNRFSELCKTVSETGRPCVISRRGEPLVKLVPVESAESAGSVWDSVEEAQARYGPLDVELEIPERGRAQRPNPLDPSER